MNERLNTQDIIDRLANRYGLSKDNAETLVKEFFRLVEKKLKEDKYVKIGGLGTFKLLATDSTKALHSGIHEGSDKSLHSRVTFTPDADLKENINRPFSHFEVVPLSEHAVIEDTLVETAEIPDDLYREEQMPSLESSESQLEQPKSQLESPNSQLDTVDSLPESSEPLLGIQPSEPNEQSGEPEVSANEFVSRDNVPAADGSASIAEFSQENTGVDEEEMLELRVPIEENTETDNNMMRYFIAIIVLAIIACGGVVAYLYFPLFADGFGEREPVISQATAQADDGSAAVASVLLADSLIQDSVKQIVENNDNTSSAQSKTFQTVSLKNKPVAEQNRQNRQAEKSTTPLPVTVDNMKIPTDYRIVGTQTTYTIKKGETLTKVAKRHFGSKAFWPLLVEHNKGVINNPDHVPHGTIIKIPKLEKK